MTTLYKRVLRTTASSGSIDLPRGEKTENHIHVVSRDYGKTWTIEDNFVHRGNADRHVRAYRAHKKHIKAIQHIIDGGVIEYKQPRACYTAVCKLRTISEFFDFYWEELDASEYKRI